MLKRFASGAAVALAASLGLSAAAHASILVNFEDRHPAAYDAEANSFSEQGITFGGNEFFIVAANNPDVSFPTGYASNFMETALEPVTMSLTGGGAFDFLSVDLGLGDFNDGLSDTVQVIGTKANCTVVNPGDCTVSTTLTVGTSFATYSLAQFTGLSLISFGAQQLISHAFPPQADGGYLAFDNVSVAAVVTDGGAAVPEPSAWAMMIVGFGGVGALMRRKGRRAAVLSAAA
jgi:hypothetical protein